MKFAQGCGPALLAALALSVAAAGAAVAEKAPQPSAFGGRWQALELHAEINLVVEGAKVTGNVRRHDSGAPITSGSIKGNTLTITFEAPDGIKTITWRGTLKGATLTFKRSVAAHKNRSPRPGNEFKVGVSEGGYGLFGTEGPTEFAATRPPVPGTLAGRVGDSFSGSSIPGAEVLLSPFVSYFRQGYSERFSSVLKTDGNGSFVFTNVPPGDYVVSALADHYLYETHGAPRPASDNSPWDGRVIAVRSGERVDGVDFLLSKKSFISGTVVDADGRPMANVEIQAYRRGLDSSTQPRLFSVHESTGSSDDGVGVPVIRRTDASGRYRLEELTPDEYYIRARVPESTQTVPRMFYVPTYYPDAIDPSRAKLVQVTAGADTPGIDFTLRLTASARITGRVSLPGRETAGSIDASVELAPVGFLPARPGNTRPLEQPVVVPVVFDETDGAFQFDGLAPGNYRIVVVANSSSGRATAIHDVSIEEGSTRVATLVLEPAYTMRGKIVVDGTPPANFQVGGVAIDLRQSDNTPDFRLAFRRGRSGRTLSPADPDGSFVVEEVVPGVRYKIAHTSFNSGNRNYRVILRYGDSAPGDAFVAQDPETKLEVHFDFSVGNVEATVLDEGKPRQGVVLLVGQRCQIQVSDVQGRVTFSSVVPGDYRLLALDDLSRNPEGRCPLAPEQLGGRIIRVERDETIREVIPLTKR